jgi:ubiquinone/menaquinone biosynthesis C-methylase UbiE
MSVPNSFKDLFGTQATDYAQFRPKYPKALFEYLASLTKEHELVWDCGTGSGQAAVELAQFYKSVRATDPSEKQLANAEKNSRVTYQQASAEKSPLQDHSADLITVAQAFHWFQHEQFFHEAKRVLKPGGAVAVWGYNLCKVTPEIDKLVFELYETILGPYWEPQRKLVEEEYRNCLFPLREVTPPRLKMSAHWSVEHLIGYLGTWSSLQTFIKRNGTNPLEEIAPRILERWGAQKTLEIQWELALRVGFTPIT